MVRLNRGLAIIGAIVVICAIGIPPTLAQRGLHVAYEWKQMDFAYRTDSDRQAAIESGAFVPANVIPVGLERHSDRLFVTLPRWKSGVPASLAYIDLNGLYFDILGGIFSVMETMIVGCANEIDRVIEALAM